MNGEIAQERLFDLRKEKGYSRKQLSEQTGISESVIVKLESDPAHWGKTYDRNIKRLADYFEVDQVYLMGDSDDAKTPAAGSGTTRQKGSGQTRQSVKIIDKTNVIPFNPMNPITGKMDLPRVEHDGEDYQEQLACFLEGQRRAFLQFADMENGTFEDLFELVNDQLNKFAEVHQIPDDQGQVKKAGRNGKDDVYMNAVFYPVATGWADRLANGTVDFDSPKKAKQLLKNGSSVKLLEEAFRTDGQGNVYDQVEIDGVKYAVLNPDQDN